MAKCPYCQKEVALKSTGKNERNKVHKEVNGIFKKEIMYSCPHCECVLGFSFFIGGLFTHRP
jgi:uncharacterized protein with PIN domain